MERVFALAEKLGQALAGHERFKALRAAEERVRKDEATMKAQEALENQLTRISELERNGKPVEVADKREVERLQDAVRSQPALQELAKAQADYFEMMHQVNRRIVDRLRPPHPPQEKSEKPDPS